MLLLFFGLGFSLFGALADQAADGAAAHAQLGIATFDDHFFFADFHDATDQAAAGHHVVAALQFGQHLLVGLGALLLGTDQQEPEDGEHQDQGNKLHQHVAAAGGGAAGLGGTHGESNGFKQQDEPPKGCCRQAAFYAGCPG